MNKRCWSTPSELFLDRFVTHLLADSRNLHGSFETASQTDDADHGGHTIDDMTVPPPVGESNFITSLNFG